jgi:hypothetical protein
MRVNNLKVWSLSRQPPEWRQYAKESLNQWQENLFLHRFKSRISFANNIETPAALNYFAVGMSIFGTL